MVDKNEEGSLDYGTTYGQKETLRAYTSSCFKFSYRRWRECASTNTAIRVCNKNGTQELFCNLGTIFDYQSRSVKPEMGTSDMDLRINRLVLRNVY